jgi:Dolichyl-phosphate-mannose-protein mannosyltransferase
MPRMGPKTWMLLALALSAGAVLRLWFIHAYPEVLGDPLIYGDIAKNWMLHGIYGLSSGSAAAPGAPASTLATGIDPTLIRLPGYPLFLILCFRLFGMEHYHAVMYAQTALDLASCLLIAGFARRIWSPRAGWWALWLAVLCPFTANFAAVPLTETPEIFCIALGFYALVRFLASPRWTWTLVLAFAWSYATLLRPDGALLPVTLCPAMVFYGYKRWGLTPMLRRAAIAGLLSILPFIAWTIRNERTFHVFQPLAPRYATDPGEPSYPGFNRWAKTVCVDLTCTWEIYWNANSDPIDLKNLPARAFDSPQQYQQTRELLDEYNRITTITPAIDAAFGALAAEHIRAHPFRYYVELPLARLADMALRPRTELLWIELRWWQYNRHNAETEFAYGYAALNLAYFVAALVGFLKRPPLRGAILVFVLLRCAVLLTLQAPEPRYTLEWFPPLIALAAIALTRKPGSAVDPVKVKL